jgi:outer membrane protein insertion porin family
MPCLKRLVLGCGEGLLAALVLLSVAGSSAFAQRGGPTGVITEVKILGNESVAIAEIRSQIRTRAGRDYDARLVEEDVARLMGTRWFADVQAFYKKDTERNGLLLTFRVTEHPVLKEVEFRGMTKLKRKEVEESTGIKVGAHSSHVKAQVAVAQIQGLYKDKGYEWAEVRLVEGQKPTDTRVVYEVFEGPKCKLRSIDFTGNDYVSDATLRTKIGSKTAIMGLVGGVYHRDDIDEDARKVRQYYQDQGFFEVKVRPVVRPDPNMGDLRVEFVVWEGTQFKVRDIKFEGNKFFTEEQLREGLVLHSGKPFREDLRTTDGKTLHDKYGSIGCIDAQINIERRYADPEKQPGVLDLVYKIEEGMPYRLGRFIVKGNDRTLDDVFRREAYMAGLVPGEPIDLLRIEKFKQRVGQLRYVALTPDQGRPMDVRVVNRRGPDQPFGITQEADWNPLTRTRMQSPSAGARLQSPGFDENTGGLEARPSRATARASQQPAREPAARQRAVGDVPLATLDEPLAPDDGPARVAPLGGGSRAFEPPADQPVGMLPIEAPPPDALPGLSRGDGAGEGVRTPPYGTDVAPGGFPSLPGSNMTDVGPDRQEPFPERAFADIITSVDEVATGRLMFGVGASSFGGLSGTFILHETNFDLFNFPRSFGDFANSRAFRGRGQEFRLELSPGTSINRAMVSFRDPYVFNLPIGFGASGYATSRFYPDWSEDRIGGRFSLGRQFGSMTYADMAFRVEDVNIYGFKYPAPAEYLAVSGHTTLATLRPSIRFDNRNDPFSPNAGSYLEFAFEQGWGSFTYPKVSIEGRTHFTTGSRADGSGKRILTLRGFFGATGTDTPLYEKWFAGDFRSMRGFAYRGVGPFIYNSNIGGVMTMLGSIEWQFPWLANDKLQQVIFSDFGTVENDYSISTFRLAVGTGARVYLPQQMFGPLPLAFDLAVPVVKGPDDRERLFTFFIGAFW